MTKTEIDLIKRLYFAKSLKTTQEILKKQFNIILTQKKIKEIAKNENNN